MSIKKEIQSAIAMHSMWKAKLDKCIQTGIFDTPADIVKLDNECYFGKWLYEGNILSAVRNSEEYKRVVDCHARFHRVAAKIVELSLSGNKTKAAELMLSDGEYSKISSELVRELTSWAKTVE